MTRDEVFRRLAFLGVGLNVTFVMWGILQVSICTWEAVRHGEHDAAIALVHGQCPLYCLLPMSATLSS